ncbi:hypothetical protein BpHYR1_017217 [Brachionus plicatilis]|uniref:Uncharacterized protein n=1 Tax=Brachionus plicatilis TaxID=10195 RepID=A0A3M7QS47_BRAPC|nr:hypothetical protein BpHYR1_017217 [Brachionus plicatilis]
MISKCFAALFLIDVIYCVNYTNFLYKHSNARAIETKQLSAFNHSINQSGMRPHYLSRVENSRRLAKPASLPRPRIKVYRLNNSIIKHLKVNRTVEPKDSLKISLKNPTFVHRLNKNVASRISAIGRERNFVRTREKPFDQKVQFHLQKSNPAISFLSNVNFYLSKLQKEAQSLEGDYKQYGRRFFYLVKYRLRKAYEELRMNLCNNVLDTEDDIDEDYAEVDGYKYTFVNSNNIIEKMKRNERRRTIRAKNEKRLIRKICN